MGNKSGSTYARAILTANNATNNATRNYYIYLDITSNDFEYTTSDEQAELLLKVTDPDGSEVTTLGSLERKTSGGETGFDITESTGIITIADNYEIVSTGTETQEWQIEVIFANLDADQNANTGKTFSANLIIQEEAIVTNLGNFAEYVSNLYTTDGENGLYYHDGTGTYGTLEAGDNSYRYSGANPNNYVCFGSDEETCPEDNLYRIIGVFDGQVKLIKADFANSDLLGTDGDYNSTTYSASDYENYKGSKEKINRYYWNYSNGDSSTNTWSASRLNTVNLNTNYLNALGSEWSEKIATTEWQVGGGSYYYLQLSAVQTAYNYEVGANKANTTYNAKIGLMYVSDYGYAASPTYWTYKGYDTATTDYRAAINNNWMYSGVYEWTLSRRSDSTDYAFRVDYTGNVNYSGVYYYIYGVRPSFYLESSVEFNGGSGSSADPYRLSD